MEDGNKIPVDSLQQDGDKKLQENGDKKEVHLEPSTELNLGSDQLTGALNINRTGVTTEIGTVKIAGEEIFVVTSEGKEVAVSVQCVRENKKHDITFTEGDEVEFWISEKTGTATYMRNKTESQEMKMNTEAVIAQLTTKCKLEGYTVKVEMLSGITQQIGITRKDVAQKTKSQILIVVNKGGMASVSYKPYDHYDEYYYLLEKSINDADFYDYIGGFIKNAGVDGKGENIIFAEELERPGIKKEIYPTDPDERLASFQKG